MTGPAGDNFRQYTGLRTVGGSLLAGQIDQSALTFTSVQSAVGWVDYRVQGARQITVGFYSQAGAFVTLRDDGVYVMGLYDESTASLTGKTLLYPSYSPSAQAVYARIGGELYKAHTDGTAYLFAGTDDSPADLKDYAVNVYASSNGYAYTRVSFSNHRVHYVPGTPFVYEERTASLPYDTAYIRVELNDVGRFPVLNRPGEYLDKVYLHYNCLASVALTGDSMAFGPPDAVVDAPLSPASSASEDKDSGSSAASSKAAGSQASINAGKSSSSKASSAPGSKFTGVIESSAAGKRAAGQKTLSAASRSSAKAEPDEAARIEQVQVQSATREQGGNVVYQIGDNRETGGSFTGGVMVYIVVVTGAILAVVLNSNKKNR